MGIVAAIQNDAAAQRFLRKFYALVLLPSQEIAGAVAMLEAQQPPGMAPLGRYVRHQWLDMVVTDHMSVFGQAHRTHPNIFDLLLTLKRIQATAAVELGQLRLGNAERRGPFVALRIFHGNLNALWEGHGCRTIDG